MDRSLLEDGREIAERTKDLEREREGTNVRGKRRRGFSGAVQVSLFVQPVSIESRLHGWSM